MTRPIESKESHQPTKAVVCLLEEYGGVHLARKKKKIGVGRYNGYGGLMEDGDETIEDVAKRELKEETNGKTHARDATFTCIGIINYDNPSQKDGKRKVMEVHFFLVNGWKGLPDEETPEMGLPAWFPKNALPYNEMMASDKLWLPHALAGNGIVTGEVIHGEDEQVTHYHFQCGDKVIATSRT